MEAWIIRHLLCGKRKLQQESDNNLSSAKECGVGGGGTNPGMCMLSRVSIGYTCPVLISVLDS